MSFLIKISFFIFILYCYKIYIRKLYISACLVSKLCLKEVIMGWVIHACITERHISIKTNAKDLTWLAEMSHSVQIQIFNEKKDIKDAQHRFLRTL